MDVFPCLEPDGTLITFKIAFGYCGSDFPFVEYSREKPFTIRYLIIKYGNGFETTCGR